MHTARGRGTPIVLIGTKKAPISTHVPELLSRVISRCAVEPLRATEARNALTGLYPRFLLTPAPMTDRAAKPFGGRIRALTDFCAMLRLFNPKADESKPVTEQEIINIHTTMGVHTGART